MARIRNEFIRVIRAIRGWCFLHSDAQQPFFGGTPCNVRFGVEPDGHSPKHPIRNR